MSRLITRVQQAIATYREIEVLQGRLIMLFESMTPAQKVTWEKWLAHQKTQMAGESEPSFHGSGRVD